MWAASNPDGVVWKISTGGNVLPTIKLGSAIESLVYADGAAWAALGEEGTVVRIDPTTDEIREYDLGHFVTSVDVRKGLIAAGVRQSIEDVAGTLSATSSGSDGKHPSCSTAERPSSRLSRSRPGTRRKRCSTT